MVDTPSTVDIADDAEAERKAKEAYFTAGQYALIWARFKKTDEQRARFAERQKQIELAQARGEGHIGNEAQAVLQQRKEAKKAQKDAQRNK
jgi:hypothetical protein